AGSAADRLVSSSAIGAASAAVPVAGAAVIGNTDLLRDAGPKASPIGVPDLTAAEACVPAETALRDVRAPSRTPALTTRSSVAATTRLGVTRRLGTAACFAIVGSPCDRWST